MYTLYLGTLYRPRVYAGKHAFVYYTIYHGYVVFVFVVIVLLGAR